ncbi:protein FAR1-RELATED SEQUENCE 5-like, partial [Bidens hawaiensis]|uniref:protein FAR1-RELATED SEQUENCE 5-like n=1 Tax=Bidens hawaiensis TaxID=980011 RepID=UPI00404AC6D7
DSSVLVEGQVVDIRPEVASSYRPVKGMMFSSINQAFDFYIVSYLHDGVLKTKRKRPTIRCGCRAHVPLKSVDGVIYEVHDFVEGHNHRMVADSDMQFVRSARKLTHVQEEAIYEFSNINLMRTQHGGFEKVGATKDDCKNFKQGLNCYIGEYDAEMIVLRMCAKRTFSSDYSFEYDVNDDPELIRVFWVDEILKSNYLAFGDIISFDATFKTNE